MLRSTEPRKTDATEWRWPDVQRRRRNRGNRSGTEVMKAKTVAATDLLADLQTALHHGTVARRVETLRRVTDLFLYAPSDYSDEQISLFDDVFHCLIVRIEISAKALLAERLAPVTQAPVRLMSTLAMDDVVEVAGPVLSQAEQLSE